MRTDRHHRQREIAILVVGLIISVIVWNLRLRFPFDDTFISFRYADHLANGLGLVWNIGGAHTEGYTNFLFILLLAVARLCSFDLLASAQALGLAATVATGFLLYRRGAELGGEYTGWLATGLFWTIPLVWINALSGMETSLFVALSVGALTQPERPRRSFICCLLATLTRPEAAILALLLLGTATRQTRRDALRAFLLFFVLPCALYAIWKLWYFGYLLPNSFYIKVVENGSTLLPGLQYVRLYLTTAILLVAATIVGRAWRDQRLVAPILWVAFLIVFYVFVRPLEGLYDRFLLPATAALCLTAPFGITALVRRNQSAFRIGLTVSFLVANVLLNTLTPRANQAFAAHEDVWDRSMDRIVQVLRALPHTESLLVGYGDAGYVVYRSEVKHLDLFGLNDTRLAHATTSRARAAIVLNEKPDLILLPVAHSTDSCSQLIEDAYGIVRSPSSAFIIRGTIEAFPYPIGLFVASESRHAAEIDSALDREIRAGYLTEPPRCLQ